MKTAAISVAALAAVVSAGPVANPSLALFPVYAEAANVCAASPYKSFTALSSLPAATSYCHKSFPLATPTCFVSKTSTKTATATVTHTSTHTSTMTSTKSATTTSTKTLFSTITDIQYLPDYFISTISTGSAEYTRLSVSTLPQNTIYTTITTTLPATVSTCSPTSTSTLAAKRDANDFSSEAADNILEARGLSNAQSSSLSKLLASVTKMGKSAEATTICHCIQSNPACTTHSTTHTTTHTTTKTASASITKTTTATITHVSTKTATTTATTYDNIETLTNLYTTTTVSNSGTTYVTSTAVQAPTTIYSTSTVTPTSIATIYTAVCGQTSYSNGTVNARSNMPVRRLKL